MIRVTVHLVSVSKLDQEQLDDVVDRTVFRVLKGVRGMAGEILAKVEEVRVAFRDGLAAAQAKIDEDFAEMRRKLEEAIAAGNPTEALAALDTFKGEVTSALGAVDPDPSFPAAAPTEG